MTDGVAAVNMSDRAAAERGGPAEKKYISFESALSLVKEEVDRALLSSPAVVRTYTSHLALARGKFFRAVSLLTCA
ncbi:MAG TPA: hypothetical protein PLP87_11860, partial [Clostridiales bacterium]|nr:hypothetical protein [Clostridiales bacterium]